VCSSAAWRRVAIRGRSRALAIAELILDAAGKEIVRIEKVGSASRTKSISWRRRAVVALVPGTGDETRRSRGDRRLRDLRRDKADAKAPSGGGAIKAICHCTATALRVASPIVKTVGDNRGRRGELWNNHRRLSRAQGGCRCSAAGGDGASPAPRARRRNGHGAARFTRDSWCRVSGLR